MLAKKKFFHKFEKETFSQYRITLQATPWEFKYVNINHLLFERQEPEYNYNENI